MSKRSTRNKIKWQVNQCLKHLDQAMDDLKASTEMADGGSKFINDHVPGIIVMIEGMRVVIEQYQDML